MVQSDITTQEPTQLTQSVVDKLNNAETVELRAGSYYFTLSKTQDGSVKIIYSPVGIERTHEKIVKMEEFQSVPDLKKYLDSDKVLEGGGRKSAEQKNRRNPSAFVAVAPTKQENKSHIGIHNKFFLLIVNNLCVLCIKYRIKMSSTPEQKQIGQIVQSVDTYMKITSITDGKIMGVTGTVNNNVFTPTQNSDGSDADPVEVPADAVLATGGKRRRKGGSSTGSKSGLSLFGIGGKKSKKGGKKSQKGGKVAHSTGGKKTRSKGRGRK